MVTKTVVSMVCTFLIAVGIFCIITAAYQQSKDFTKSEGYNQLMQIESNINIK